MPIPTIVKEIQKSLKTRKEAKKTLDESINLSNLKDKELTMNLSNIGFVEGTTMRLLDEGALYYEGGEKVRLFFEKGTIQAFYDTLSDDYVGYVNLAHLDIWELPLNLGTWTKQDLSIVDIGNGRVGLNVDVHLNEKLHIVQDLMAQEIPLSLSAEVGLGVDYEESQRQGYPCIEKINIKGFSIVGNPANANSTSIDLSVKGEEEMTLKEFLTGKKDEEVVETKVEEVQEEETLATEEEQPTEEKVELSAEQVTMLESFMSEYTQLKTENESLKSEIEDLKAQLSSKEQEVEKEGKLNSQVEDVLSKLETLMNGKLESKPEVKEEMGFLGNLEPKGEE